MNTFITILMAILFLLAGISCLNRTKEIQRWLIQFFETSPVIARDHPLARWTQQTSFIMLVKLIGVLSIINFIMLAYVITVSSVL
ncbi:MAG: hypothetical protein GXP10_05365 [Gammaproteobacteria bacterium]|nr:hypothetical protein [Gammaproteobacteria bacterium]